MKLLSEPKPKQTSSALIMKRGHERDSEEGFQLASKRSKGRIDSRALKPQVSGAAARNVQS